jgi:hypothetical protein
LWVLLAVQPLGVPGLPARLPPATTEQKSFGSFLQKRTFLFRLSTLDVTEASRDKWLMAGEGSGKDRAC